jgi:hypothetical protein
MRKTTTSKLVDLANVANGKAYPEIGYLVYTRLNSDSDIPRIYSIMNNLGGLTYSRLNRNSPKATCNALRGYIINTSNKKES